MKLHKLDDPVAPYPRGLLSLHHLNERNSAGKDGVVQVVLLIIEHERFCLSQGLSVA